MADWLTDDTREQILWRFDCEHAFPFSSSDEVADEKPEQTKAPGYLSRAWRYVTQCFRSRRNAAPPVRDQQRTDNDSGPEDAAGA
jgi:hypothetical protein